MKYTTKEERLAKAINKFLSSYFGDPKHVKKKNCPLYSTVVDYFVDNYDKILFARNVRSSTLMVFSDIFDIVESMFNIRERHIMSNYIINWFNSSQNLMKIDEKNIKVLTGRLGNLEDLNPEKYEIHN